MKNKNSLLLLISVISFFSLAGGSMVNEHHEDFEVIKELLRYFKKSSSFNDEQKRALGKKVNFRHIDKIFSFTPDVDPQPIFHTLVKPVRGEYLSPKTGAWFFRKSSQENSRTLVVMLPNQNPPIKEIRIVGIAGGYIPAQSANNKKIYTLIDVLEEMKTKGLDISKYQLSLSDDISVQEKLILSMDSF